MPPQQDIQLGSFLDVKRFLLVLRQKLFPILFVGATAALGGVALASFWPEQFQSKTVLLLKERKLIDNSDFMRSTQPVPLLVRQAVLQQELRARKWVKSVLDKLQWVEYHETAADTAARNAFLDKVQDPSRLRVDIQPDPKGDTLLVLSFSWDDPVKAHDFVLAMRDFWIEHVIEDYKRGARDQLMVMQVLLNDKAQDFRMAQQKLEEFETDNQLPLFDTEDSSVTTQNILNQDILNLQSQISAAEQRIALLEEQLQATEPVVQQRKQVQNPDWQAASARARAADMLVRQFAAKGYTDLHPAMKQAKSELDSALSELEGMEQWALDEIFEQVNPQYAELQMKLMTDQVNLEGAQKSLDQKKEQLETVKVRIRNLPALVAQWNALKEDVRVKRELVSLQEIDITPLRDRVNSFDDRESSVQGDAFGSGVFEVLEDPSVASEPTKPMTLVFILAAFFFGLSASAVWFLARDFFRETFNTSDEVRRFLKLPVLGSVAPILTELEVRRMRLQRVLSVVASLLFLVAFAAAIYVCTSHPEVIPAALRDRVAEMKKGLG
ncbi:MAG: hypothetical protein AB1486_22830 [Planctomycetota bacterium]